MPTLPPPYPIQTAHVCFVCHVQPEDGHYQAPKHVVVPYVENTLYSTNKYSCVRPVHTLYISYFIEHDGDDEPHELKLTFQQL